MKTLLSKHVIPSKKKKEKKTLLQNVENKHVDVLFFSSEE